MMRSSVVFPQPDGPSSATSSPVGISRSTSSQRAEGREVLDDGFDLDAHRVISTGATGRFVVAVWRSRSECHSTRLFAKQRHEREHREQRRERERGDEVVFVVEDLDVERQRVRLAADVAAHDRHGAELAHRPRVAEDHAVEQRPLHVRERHPEEGLPAARAERQRGLLLLGPLLLHQRDQLPRDEGKGHEDRAEDDARRGEDDLRCRARMSHGPNQPYDAVEQHVDEPADHRRDRERQVDQRDEELLAAELELGDRPRRRESEDEVQRDGDRRRRAASAGSRRARPDRRSSRGRRPGPCAGPR